MRSTVEQAGMVNFLSFPSLEVFLVVLFANEDSVNNEPVSPHFKQGLVHLGFRV